MDTFNASADTGLRQHSIVPPVVPARGQLHITGIHTVLGSIARVALTNGRVYPVPLAALDSYLNFRGYMARTFGVLFLNLAFDGPAKLYRDRWTGEINWHLHGGIECSTKTR